MHLNNYNTEMCRVNTFNGEAMKSTSKKIDINHTIITHADLLAQRHEDYVSEFVKRANTELYCILAEILELHEKLDASPNKDKLIKQMRKSLKEKYAIKTQANTKTTALVVKYVTRASRKTAHVYGRVLDVAINNGISSTGLIDFIKANGGIDKIRIAVDSAEVQKQKKQIEVQLQKELKQSLHLQTNIGQVQFTKSASSIPHASDVDFVHMLCTFNYTTKTHEIVGIMYPSSALEAQSMGEYLTMLDVAAASDNGEIFYDRCKERGLNMDLIHRWMSANNIANAAAAQQLIAELSASTMSAVKVSNQEALKLAA
jgi:hypothetical protein